MGESLAVSSPSSASLFSAVFGSIGARKKAEEKPEENPLDKVKKNKDINVLVGKTLASTADVRHFAKKTASSQK